MSHSSAKPVTVTYPGLLQTVTRSFESRELAVSWLRAVGRLDSATIS